ncbi:leucine-rich repeat-containing protein 43 [Anabas testudineus]|uniref:leucine-rich repeat-containing protein 43 n=1 Tax=Anabas testudineus TaxID=64144 RepID=UPI000E4621B7|nr:leucine-rich repeat-containing protein 43 [Anabas testudineus]
MSSNKLSAVLEEQIRRLCLNDFPCGYGSWRKIKYRAETAGTEETDLLLDLLNCPHSPWRHDESWSPQAPALRWLAVLSHDHLHPNFIYNYFTTLRVMDKGVSVIDDGLLKFSKLEELVLSVNEISEISVENLPSTLKILELRANRLSSLNTLTNHPPPRLQYLGLSSNSLGSHEDVCHLTGRLWPQLVCLDLSDCEFQDQPTLLNTLCTLPCLKTLVLEGNPFTLACSYPGFAVDSLPQLSFLDASCISPEERRCFRGLANMKGLIVDQASIIVSVGRMRGIPDPMMSADKNSPDFPVVTYSYFVTYDFLSHQTPVDLKVASEPKNHLSATGPVVEVSSRDVDLQSNCERQLSTAGESTGLLVVNTEENCHDTTCVSGRHSTSKLAWSESMDFNDTQMYTVSDLRALKKFLNRGLHLSIEEEKVLSWPVESDDVLVDKPSRSVKEKKGGNSKDSPIKPDSTKDKSKDKKKKSVPELVQNAPIRRILGSVRIPLQSLVKGSKKDLGKRIKDEDKESKLRGVSGSKQKNTASSKGKGRKGREVDVHTDSSMSIQLEPVTVALGVELEKWQSAPEAPKYLLQQQ